MTHREDSDIWEDYAYLAGRLAIESRKMNNLAQAILRRAVRERDIGPKLAIASEHAQSMLALCENMTALLNETEEADT
jgi:hypothetical protein